MSSPINSSLPYIGQQITLYGGFITFFLGIVGELLTLIVFLSLETFRQSPCAFYLTIMSFSNIGQLLFGLFSRILITGFAIDWTTTSLPYCKFRSTFFQLCSSMSYACLCLATIDQYLATCARPRWQQLSNIKLAYKLIIISFLFSIAYLIPYPIYLTQLPAGPGVVTCNMNNPTMLQYRNYFVVIFMLGYVPDFISVFFAILAYRNLQQLAYRTVPLVRQALDKQLTRMVLVQVMINLITNVPFVTVVLILYATVGIGNPVFSTVLQFINSIVIILFYTYFASSFYIYMCVSERFRRQFKHAVFNMYLSKGRQRRGHGNQIGPN